MKFNTLLKIGFSILLLESCGSDDKDVTTTPESKLNIPVTYKFTNTDGESTVSFSGQTTRLKQGAEILSDFLTFGITEETIDNKLNNGEGFTDTSLNGTKKIKNKIAEAVSSSVDQAEIRATFDGYITDQVTKLLSQDVNAVSEATRGSAGKLGNRYVNEKGLELNQAFNKGLIGALTLDQIVNDYLTLTEGADVQKKNDEGTTVEGKPYTDAEHFWDEAYGYLYGASDVEVLDNPNSKHIETVVDSFLYKYVQRVEGDADFKGIADAIFQAYKTGRAAIVAKDYVASKKQADIIRQKLSEVVAIRAVYYLKQGGQKIKDDSIVAVKNGTAFHDLSEGYGFVYSLQFTHNPITKAPYFTKVEVDGFIETLDAEDGFWSLADPTGLPKLDEMANTIASKFNFTVDQAKSTEAEK